MKTFKEYLQEVFKLELKEYNFGLNQKPKNNSPEYSDQKFDKTSSEEYFTFFKFKDYIYKVTIDDAGNVYFAGTNKQNPLDDDFEMKRLFNTSNIRDMIEIFNNVAYIVSKIIKKINPKEIRFSGADAGLEKFYSKLVNNSTVKTLFSNAGYEYDGIDDLDTHIFRRMV